MAKRTTSLLLAMLLTLGVGCTTVAADAPTVVRVGTGVSDPSSEVVYALELGMFKKRGLDVQMTQMAGGAAEIAAVAGGSLDIAESNVASIAAAHLRGLPFVYIAPAAQYSSVAPTTVLVCAKSAPYATGKDLDGKTIGVVALHDMSQIGPSAWMDKTGGDSSTAHFAELPMSAVDSALARGTIDASSISEPYLHVGLQRGQIRILAPMFDALGAPFVQNGWFTTTDWLKANPVAARAFADAILEAARWANRNHQASAEILKKYSRVPPDVVDTMTRATFAEHLDAKLFQPVIDEAAKYKVLDHRFPADEIIAQ